MRDAYFIVEFFDHKSPVFWSCISSGLNQAIAIFNEVICWELVGNNGYIFYGDIKPGYYTFEDADNYYLDQPIQSFRLPDSTLHLIPVSQII